MWRILVFSPEGELVATVDPQDLPGGFSPPRGLRAVADGFWTRYFEATLKHSYDGGDIVETIRYPAAAEDLRNPTPLDDGGFLGLADLPPLPALGLRGEPPGPRAVLRLARAGDGWKLDTIGALDIRHMILFMEVRGQSSRSFEQVSRGQPFSDTDLFWIDPGTESVGIVRRNGPPGVVEIVDISAAGDTLWRQRLSLPAVPLTRERAERAIEEVVATVRPAGVRHGLTDAQVRDIVVDALHIPSHLPPVRGMAATASGEIWLATPPGRRRIGRLVLAPARRRRLPAAPRPAALDLQAPGRLRRSRLGVFGGAVGVAQRCRIEIGAACWVGAGPRPVSPCMRP